VLKDQASVEEAEAQASKEEAKGQAYQAYKTENKESLVLLAYCKKKGSRSFGRSGRNRRTKVSHRSSRVGSRELQPNKFRQL